MIKDFFEKHSYLKLTLQHLAMHGGIWQIRIYNTTCDFGFDPVFEHYIRDEEISNLNVDFENIIMPPIINWFENCEKGGVIVNDN